jgi:hypothetical protein
MTAESAICHRRIVIYVMAITYRESAGSEDKYNKKGVGSWHYSMKGRLLGKAAPEYWLASFRHWD